MPKKYVYTKRGKTLNYSEDKLEIAVKAVHGGLSVRKAAVAFGVPKSTIGDRMSGKHEVHVERGRPPHIPREIENKIADSVKMAARRGIGLTRKQVLQRTNVFCQRMPISSRYTHFKAGKDWWEGLKRRHPDVAIKKPEKLSSTRARMMNREVVNKYFDDLATLIEGLNHGGKAHLIWNCDEMGKNFEHNPVKVAAAKGESCVSRTTPKSSNMTVMACVNGTGRRMPPMFVVKGKTSRSLHGFNTKEAPIGTRWFYQKNGWMDDSVGDKWFNDVFLKFCGSERPQLLILYRHSSHESLAILMRAMEEGIHILALPPHTTHFLQPLDRAVFGPLNRNYNEICSAFLQSSPLHQINKWTFPSLFRQAWDQSVTCTNIKSGFKACGIIPLDRTAISESAFAPSDPSDCPVSPVVYNPSERCDHHVISGSTQSNSSVPANPMALFENTTSAADQTTNPYIDHLRLESVQDSVVSYNGDPVLSQFCPGSVINPLSTDCASKTTEIIHELNLSGTSDVLDISDPNTLFQLIEGGEISLEPVTDVTGNELIVPYSSPVPEPKVKIDESFVSKAISSVNSATVESMFIPPTACNKVQRNRGRKQSKKAITNHRLLTSRDIINEKLKVVQEKQEKEQNIKRQKVIGKRVQKKEKALAV